MTPARAVALVALPLVLVGCASDTIEVTPLTSAKPRSPVVATTPVGPGAARGLGETITTRVGTVTAHDFLPDVKMGAAPGTPGTHWSAIDAEFCWKRPLPPDADGPVDSITLGWEYWSVSDAQNRRFIAFTGQSSMPFLTPRYPRGEAIDLGECARGWIMVPVGADARITQVRYKNDTDPAAFWVVGP